MSSPIIRAADFQTGMHLFAYPTAGDFDNRDVVQPREVLRRHRTIAAKVSLGGRLCMAKVVKHGVRA